MMKTTTTTMIMRTMRTTTTMMIMIMAWVGVIKQENRPAGYRAVVVQQILQE
jgi:hypothetical protein